MKEGKAEQVLDRGRSLAHELGDAANRVARRDGGDYMKQRVR